VTFRFAPTVAPRLVEFLADCHNAEEILGLFAADPAAYSSVVKMSVPLGMRHAVAMVPAHTEAFDKALTALREALASVPVTDRLAAFPSARERLPPLAIPFQVLSRIDRFLEDGGESCVYRPEAPNDSQPSPTKAGE
jgi:hypothetical protein